MAKTENELESEKMSGCLLTLWSLLITTPMWLVMFHQVLKALGDAVPQWTWLLFWIYVPTIFVGIILTGFAKMFFAGK